VWATAPPSIVAESLEAVPDPLVTALHPGQPASGLAVARSLAQALATEEAPDSAPAWLLPAQVQSFRRLLAAIRRYDGALLADPVGTGKTYVALAVARVLNRGSTACLVPATLVTQWRCTAARLGVEVTLCSHEQASRGVLPQGRGGLVVIDESHHFRNSRTKRYGNVAAWLGGQRALLVTATPVVNRTLDLATQLLLTIRDDALLLDGVVSLMALLRKGDTAPALGQIVIEGRAVGSDRPTVIRRTSRATKSECAAMDRSLILMQKLRLSRSEPIRALLRTVLLRAADSSSAALHGALLRYSRLLRHAQDALGSGRRMERAELRRFAALLGDQLIWWELMPTFQDANDIELEDLRVLDAIIPELRAIEPATDGKLNRLSDVLGDATPTLVFTGFRETVRYIRDRLGGTRLAWCTGECAGIAHRRSSRQDVLRWFRYPESSILAPRHLVVTDVAAEGLDLQRAARVVHYDLPWTPMRMEQREGRSVRYGSSHSRIEVVQFAAPPALERSLRLGRTLASKRQLPGKVGLGPAGTHIWRLRSELAARFTGGGAPGGVARVMNAHEGLLAGFTIFRRGEHASTLSTTLLRLEPDGTWSESPEVVSHWLEQAARDEDIGAIDHARLREWLALLARPIKERLNLTGTRRWNAPDPVPEVRRLVMRLQQFIRSASRMHWAERLVQLEHAIDFATRGHTAGEARVIERLTRLTDLELEQTLPRLPPGRPHWDGFEARLTGIIVFGPRDRSLP
jgi:superfamily II DNA or RNA helicase